MAFPNPDLNPIENMWAVLKKQVCVKKPTNYYLARGLWEACWWLTKATSWGEKGQETFNQILEWLYMYFWPSKFGHIFRGPLSELLNQTPWIACVQLIQSQTNQIIGTENGHDVHYPSHNCKNPIGMWILVCVMKKPLTKMLRINQVLTPSLQKPDALR